jgi:hypothetical protein
MKFAKDTARTYDADPLREQSRLDPTMRAVSTRHAKASSGPKS